MKSENVTREITLKRLLDEKKTELLKRLYHDAVFEKLGRNYKAEFERGMDTADWSVVDSIQSLGLKLVDIRQSELLKMSEAQRKLEEGSYGICEECGVEISDQRMAAMIYAIHCLNCAAQNEAKNKE
jgi:DnaK suppressor protein